MSVKLTFKEQQLMLRFRRSAKGQRTQSTDNVPAKKKSKPLGYKMQNTFKRSVEGCPGGTSLVRQMDAKGTGCRTTANPPGQMKSMRNANTTQGSYVRTELRDQTGDVISNRQGRRI
jgi:hypothetical protein